MSDEINAVPVKPKKVKLDVPTLILAALVTVGYFLTLYFLLTNPIRKESELLIGEMIGALTTVWIAFMFHFIGHTASSAKKTELLAQANPVDPNT